MRRRQFSLPISLLLFFVPGCLQAAEQYQRTALPHHDIVAVLLSGMMLALSLYNFTLFFTNRDKAYLWYSLAGLCVAVVWTCYFGVLPRLTGYTDPEDDVINIAEWASGFFMLLFNAELLDIGQEFPVIYRIYCGALVSVGAALPAFLWLNVAVPFTRYWPSMLPLLLLLLGSVIWRFRNGYRAGFLLITGYGLLGLVMLVAALSTANILALSAYQPLWFSAASAVAILLLGLALQDRSLWLQRNKQKPPSLAVISHELRTPLASVLSIVRLLGKTPLDTTQRKLVDTLDHSGDALMSLLDDTLDLSLLGDSGMGSRLEIVQGDFDLRALLENIAVLMKGRALEKGILFTCDIARDVPANVRGDIVRIRQILMNLLNNAVKFTDSGIVKLNVNLPTDSTASGVVQFKVMDTGIGMSQALQKRIFLPFQQGKDIQYRFGGTGLGLNISRDLARAMGGDITVESREGVGSTFLFSVSLPVAITNVLISKTPAIPVPLDLVGDLKILVVDDAEINRIAARAELEHDGHSVTLASSAEEALLRLREEKFDGVLMDVNLPGMDGVSAIQQIRQWQDAALNDMVIIACSAWLQESQKRELIESGADAISLKPVDLQLVYGVFASRIRGGMCGAMSQINFPGQGSRYMLST
ncbi:MAG TPA: ATP-binding protein [Pseudomonadales bacterium]|nr:ATP-binding protein [Pseudomonadales bacterium]